MPGLTDECEIQRRLADVATAKARNGGLPLTDAELDALGIDAADSARHRHKAARRARGEHVRELPERVGYTYEGRLGRRTRSQAQRTE
jgi:hypothetical protein